jgi:ribosomal protein L11 methyltransferase
MPFLQFTLDLGARKPEPYEDALFALGALSVTLVDAGDDPVLEPAPGAMPLWPSVVVSAVFPSNADVAAIRASLGATPGLDPLLVAEKSVIESVADRAWEREWLKDFRPMRFGERLWVCPGGQRPPDVPVAEGTPDTSGDAAHGEPIPTRPPVLLELDPGLAFGTGTHATTALCLEWLDGGASSGWLTGADVLDYGCGSGILAIAALKLGARSAIAMDIDPQALLATRENAARNAVDHLVTVTDERECAGATVDVLVANILAGPLVDLAPLLAARVRKGGRIALSGLLLEQADEVTAAYRPWFDIALTGAREDWGLLTGPRRE